MKGILDMVSIVGDINKYEFKNFINSFGFDLDPKVSYKNLFGWKSYKHNWYIKNDDYSYFIGYSLNTKENMSDRFMVEFNPSKVDYKNDKYLKKILLFVLSNLDNFKIGYADIAFDFNGISTEELIIDKCRKRNYRKFYYAKTNPTIYIGNSKTDGSIKIYDKARELNLNSSIEKTRYEVTLKVDLELSKIRSYCFKGSLPICYVKDNLNVYNLKIRPGDKLLLYAVNNGFDINQLTYEQKKRLDVLMSDSLVTGKSEIKKIELTSNAVEEALISSVIDIFNSLL